MGAGTRKRTAAGPVVALTWGQVRACRLRRQGLLERRPAEEMLGLAGALCGLHAQLMSSAELSLWARIEDLPADAVSRALWKERSLVKTWAMRGTLHLLRAAEYPLWVAAQRTRRHYLSGAWLRYFGVTREELEGLLAAVAQALEGGPLTREELVAEVTRLTGSAALGEKVRDGFGAMLKPAAFRGDLCFGPSLGQNVRFARPDRWLPGWQEPGAAAPAIGEITRRYLAAYGPATRDDYARWWGTRPRQAGEWIAGLGDEVAPVQVGEVRAWMLAGDVDEAAAATAPPTVRLLPAFDQYVLAAGRLADAFLPGPFQQRVYRAQGWISPVLLVAGRLDGVWSQERQGDRLAIRVEPFVELPEWARRATEAEAERLAAFSGGTPELTWQP